MTIAQSQQPAAAEIAADAWAPSLAGPEASAPFALTDLQGAYRIGELEFFEASTPAYVAHGYAVPALDLQRLTRAVREVLAGNEALRTALTADGWQQILDPDPDWQPQVVDLRHLDAARGRELFLDACRGAGERLPSLESGPQLACCVVRTAATPLVLLALRLFVLDARSIGLVCRAIADAYLAAAGGTASPPGLFGRYLEGLEAYRRTPSYRESVDHWRRRLPQLPPGPDLPAAPGGGRIAAARFRRAQHRLAAPAWKALRANAREAGLSVNAVLCAAYADCLRRWSARQSFSLTALVSTRSMLMSDEDVDGCVGNFGTTMLLECAEGDSFQARAEALQAAMMTDLPHCHVSAVEVIREGRRAGAWGDGANVPYVFASGLDVRDDEELPLQVELPGWGVAFKSMQTPQVLLDHQVFEDGGELVCNFDHVAAAFPAGLVEELVATHAQLVAALASGPGAWRGAGRPALPAAATRARERANRTAASVPWESVFSRIDAVCASSPERLAILAGDGELSYAEAKGRLTGLAAVLRGWRSQPPPLVGLLAEKSAAQYLAALAIVEYGSAYVPLSVDWPPQRLARLIAEAGLECVLADATGERILAGLDDPPAVLGVAAAESIAAPSAPLARPAPDSLAYVIYTSGSTGAPKGVAIPHGGLVNTVADVIERFDFSAEDRILSLSELNFDLSAFDLFGALCCGASVVIPPYSETPDPALWIEALKSSEATVWNSVPALMEMLLDFAGEAAPEALASLRLVMLSGDWIPLDLPERIRAANPQARVVALGGATEASIWSNFFAVESVDPAWKSIPYGTPLANQRFHVLDQHFEPVPTWVPGELFIAGDGLAAGYHGSPELTAERFPSHPLTGERLYRSGDLGRYRDDGVLEFLGRVDEQTKLRGYRLDLLEIEQHLTALPQVRAAACCIVGEGAAQILVAFVVVAAAQDPDPERLRQALAGDLPRYAIPSRFRAVDSLPLTANGKRDVRRLTELALTAGPGVAEGPSRAPESATERALAAIWRDVCGVEVGDVEDDFFAVGGSSLLAVRLVRRIERELGVELALSVLFEHNTVASQAALLERCEGPAATASPLVSLREEGERELVLLHPVGGHLLGYRALVEALPPELAVLGLQAPAAGEMPPSLARLGAAYADAIEQRSRSRPPHLAGWSLGGVLALEVAGELERRGCEVASVTLIDSYVATVEAQRTRGEEKEEAGADDDGAAIEADDGRHRRLAELLRQHRVEALPACPLLAIVAARQDPNAFAGLLPFHLGVAAAADRLRLLSVDADHYSIVKGGAAEAVATDLARIVQEEGPRCG